MAYLVQEDALVYKTPVMTPLLAVETSAWYTWLEEVTRFTFRDQHGTFSARKERVSHGRGGYYWRAYRKEKGKLCRVYLGKSEHLTMARLKDAVQKLAWHCAQTTETCTQQHDLPGGMVEAAPGESQPVAPAREIPHLLRTKSHVPVFQEQQISRAHLVRRLNAGMKSRLILLSATAGSGKTTLLSEWARQSSAAVAWISLDKGDNDLVRFWSYILAGVRRASFHGIEQVQEMLYARPLGLFQSILSAFINVLDEEAKETVIVLDDYHLIETQEIHDTLVFFLEHLPEHVHLVLASRYDPPFSITQFRAKRQLIELRMADLSFTLPEAERLFARAEHLPLSRDNLAALLERTEGWITGLRLAALSSRTQRDVSSFISSFKGNHRFIADYLMNEILERQPDNVRHFLFSTSVLESFTTSLCDALTGEGNAKVLLAYLEQKNLFLSALDENGFPVIVGQGVAGICCAESGHQDRFWHSLCSHYGSSGAACFLSPLPAFPRHFCAVVYYWHSYGSDRGLFLHVCSRAVFTGRGPDYRGTTSAVDYRHYRLANSGCRGCAQ